MLDRIELRGISARGHHGWFTHEREHGQPFVVDVTLGVDARPAAASDELSDTVDYDTLGERVVHAVEGEPVKLVETLAQRIADICLDDVRVENVEVTVHKPEAPTRVPIGDVTVTIRRARK
ncbi:dihydroneopterin aldolase [Actinobacteria bacterium YIM 96077]|uniref:7,8-dihydroneopterin aldolase n=1 Tax=Phytoactinopolyspora halophila TaxID=1981511 RepID=A0A329R0K3_9ACTN|nr:dihydroneopterin aldolase [Phytoactinopolyspora halophila]AYY11394.1 dihydroneopterin aldolase [Actinobacteria bacterium YIM 96077]RAW18125.1 dihydroneopterin aldolase [Phytoactinopolyspora halophila]